MMTRDQLLAAAKAGDPTAMDQVLRLFCEESSLAGWGLNMARPQRNLVRAVFKSRKWGAR
jgi:hypothetical protein